MTETTLNIRVLPPDTPGIPASIPYHPETGYANNGECGERITQEDMTPEAWSALAPVCTLNTIGFYCTLPPHGDTPHATHARLDGVPMLILVWGGE